jgi:hypothetical protein
MHCLTGTASSAHGEGRRAPDDAFEWRQTVANMAPMARGPLGPVTDPEEDPEEESVTCGDQGQGKVRAEGLEPSTSGFRVPLPPPLKSAKFQPKLGSIK